MHYDGLQEIIMDYHELLWTILDYCGLAWIVIDYNGLLSIIVHDHEDYRLRWIIADWGISY
jgi:hypothetical protein